jgi:periplasmic copper chaperone A
MLAVALSLWVMPAFVQAQDKPVVASDGWIKLPADGETGAQAFANINNPGMYDAYVVSGTTDVAEKIELRDAKKGNAAADDVTLVHYETTSLNASGQYLFLSGLKRPLKEGEKVWISLKLDTNETVDIEATVKKAP